MISAIRVCGHNLKIRSRYFNFILTHIDCKEDQVLCRENNLKFFTGKLAHSYLPLISGEDILITHTKQNINDLLNISD